jgi:hypothetical protein
VFGREGHVLPLGPAVQHTGEIDPAHPLQQLWLFGRPARPLEGFAQAKVDLAADGSPTVAVVEGIEVVAFGDAAGIPVGRPG